MTEKLKQLIQTLPEGERAKWANEVAIATGERSGGDYDWVDEADHLKGIQLETGLKMMPRDAQGEIMAKFKTDKHTYKILPTDQVSLLRWHTFQQAGISAGTGRSFKAIIDAFNKSSQLAVQRNVKHEDAIINIVTFNTATINEIKDFSQERWEAIYYSCSVLIVKEGEDLRKWDIEEQNEKIQDWNEYGYINGDFFRCLGKSLASFPQVWNVLTKNQSEPDPSFMEVFNIIEGKGE